MLKKALNQDKVEAKIYALSLIYQKEESCRQSFIERVSYTPEEIDAVIDSVTDNPEFQDWIKSVIPLMQRREDTIEDINDLIEVLKKSVDETIERDTKIFELQKRHFNERQAQSTSEIPKLVEKVKQADGIWNKIKAVFIGISQNLKESVKTTKRHQKELRELRRSKKLKIEN